MTITPEQRKTDLVERLATEAQKRVGDAEAESAAAFVRRYFALVAPDDIIYTSFETLLGGALSLWQFGEIRTVGEPKVRLFNPTVDANGWGLEHTVIEIVNDDMPFLVDSVSAEVTRLGRNIHLLLHPVVRVRRDAGGKRAELTATQEAKIDAIVESYMHIEIDQETDSAELETMRASLEGVLHDVRAAVTDWQAMRAQLRADVADLEHAKLPMPQEEVAEARAFLEWLDKGNFILLGFRRYGFETRGDKDYLPPVIESGLGILRNFRQESATRAAKPLTPEFSEYARTKDLLIITKANTRSTVHRNVPLDRLGIKRYDDNGNLIGEDRFLGLFTSAAYSRSVREIPMLRLKAKRVIEGAGLDPHSHNGKALVDILETFPRDEFFQITDAQLFDIARGILLLQERHRVALFTRKDVFERFVSCYVFVPRDQNTVEFREKAKQILEEQLNGRDTSVYEHVTDAPLARILFIIKTTAGAIPEIDEKRIEAMLSDAARTWGDRLLDTLCHRFGEEEGIELQRRYKRAFSAAYSERFSAEAALYDIQHIEDVLADGRLVVDLYRHKTDERQFHCKIIHTGPPVPLSEIMPRLENMGLKVLAEEPYEVQPLGGSVVRIRDFSLDAEGMQDDLSPIKQKFQETFVRVWNREAENDGFNRLVITAELEWHEVVVLRAYNKYIRQIGVNVSEQLVQQTLSAHSDVARLLIQLFETHFDPSLGSATLRGASMASETVTGRHLAAGGIRAQIEDALDRIKNPDEDRILRLYLTLIEATLRTNYYQRDASDNRKPYLSFKLDSQSIRELPLPRPMFEISVYSPSMEGIHLRAGKVARGGIRWSDRREDFRTEVLGLVKAQMVKNTVIVPVGSKGGFFVKRPPAERDALLEEGIACYKMFINGLLDITDNIDTAANKVLHPADVVRHDADDSYLVVAADKGTAKFSDIANGLSIEHGYWLGDAFASGGSAGFDHKDMGITSRGGWESVMYHFRTMGHDCQAEDFACVGIGDMSGDVFGNGMLRSRHTRLLAAFDHRHIFIDPNPDAEKSFVERERMFALSRSSWEDYDKSQISKGGGVFARNLKAVTITPEMREVLGIGADVESLSPTDLISAILKAPVDLLWNGGIGTYVKATSESNADVGDRANNALRINGDDLRCKIVGEGGNLGFTQKGRIEAARKGVLLNTDFIDNSAGVDTSDHEVNIKILLNDAVQRGEMDTEARNKLLHSMTDEVARLVLNDNYRQNGALGVMEHMSVSRIGSQAHFIRTLESRGQLDRQIESLPSDAELAERRTHRQGLTRPELSVLLSYSKIVLYQQLLDSDVPEDPFLSHELVRYFPEPLHQKYAAHMQRHRLKREIIATAVTNSIVNRMGATFVLRTQEDTGQTGAAVVKAYNAARQIIHARELWSGIDALDGKVNQSAQIDALMKVWSLLRNMSRWLLNRPGSTLGITALVERYQPGMDSLRKALPDSLSGTGNATWGVDLEKWQGMGFPAELAHKLAAVPALEVAMDIIETSLESARPVEHVARVFFDLGEALDIEWLRGQIDKLAVESRWHAQARGALRDELAVQQRAMVSQILASEQGRQSADGAVTAWLQRDDPQLQFTRGMLDEIRGVDVDYPIASVALRRLAQIAQSG